MEAKETELRAEATCVPLVDRDCELREKKNSGKTTEAARIACRKERELGCM